MTLEQAVQLIQSGDAAAGRRLLGRILRADPANAAAWLWMSEAVDRPEHKRDCLLRVLAIEPQNKTARARLGELVGQEPAPMTARPPQVDALASDEVETKAPVSLPIERAASVPTRMTITTKDDGADAAPDAAQTTAGWYAPAQEATRRRGYRNTMLAAMLVVSAVCGIVLIVVTLTVIKPRGEERLKPTPETALYEATLWCLPCQQNSTPIILWDQVGDGISRGGQAGQLPHNTTVSVLAEVWSEPEARTYFKVSAQGQQGWVPEAFVKKDAAVP